MTHIDPNCTGLRTYPSPQSAWAFVKRINSVKPKRQTRAVYVKPEPQEPFRCPKCHLYHCRRPS